MYSRMRRATAGVRACLCAAASVALAAVNGASPADAATKTLRVTIQLPMKSVLGQNLLLFKSEVETGSGGSLEIQIFDSAQLYADKDVPQAVASGEIDMGVATLSRFADAVPAVDVLTVPFALPTASALASAVAPGSAVRQPLDDAIAKTGARVLWWQAYGGTVLLSKGGPVRSPADMAGKRVRVFGGLMASWVTANGGLPIEIGSGEQYAAYQRGAVDIGMTGADSLRSRKLWDVMDHVTVANMAAIEFVVVINTKVFAGLTEAEQTLVTETAKKVEAKLRAEFADLEVAALDAGRRHKMTVYTPTAGELDEWRKSAAPVRDEFLKAAGPLGRQVYDAAAAFP
jgi:C4-dicarboxylate-binding protein DctP